MSASATHLPSRIKDGAIVLRAVLQFLDLDRDESCPVDCEWVIMPPLRLQQATGFSRLQVDRALDDLGYVGLLVRQQLLDDRSHEVIPIARVKLPAAKELKRIRRILEDDSSPSPIAVIRSVFRL